MECVPDEDDPTQDQGLINICDLPKDILVDLYKIFNDEICQQRILNGLSLHFPQLYQQALPTCNTDTGANLCSCLGRLGMNANQLVDLFEKLDMIEAKSVLIIYDKVDIKQQPEENIIFSPGSDIRMSCKASAIPPPEYQWFRDGEPLPDQRKPQLIIHNARKDHAGDYWCVVSNTDPENGKRFAVETSRCRVTPNAAYEGRTFLLNLPNDRRQALNNIFKDENCWQRVLDKLPIQLRPVCQQADSSNRGETLCTHFEHEDKNVNELVDLFEELDMEEAKSVLIKYEQVFIKEQPEENITVFSGNPIRVSCKGSGIPPPKYQWYQDGKLLLNQTNPQLVILNANMDHAGDYSCLVSNTDPEEGKSFSAQTNNCHVTVKYGSKPEITIQPTLPSNDKIIPGTSIILHCRAKSISPVQYEWFRDGIHMPEERSGDLLLKHLQPIDGKHKWTQMCVVSNNFGRVLSKQVTIELDYEEATTQRFAKDKVALIIGNNNYKHLGCLKKAVADAEALAKAVSEQLQFRVFAMTNLTRTEMLDAIQLFCQDLEKDTYALFYFAGHGYELHGKKYLLPTDAQEEDPVESVCIEDHVLKLMQERHPKLCAGLFDACLYVPQDEKFHSSIPKSELQPVKDRNMILGFATTSLRRCFEDADKDNGAYMTYLQKRIIERRPLIDILNSVSKDVYENPDIPNEQVPWIECGLPTPLSLADALEDNCNWESWTKFMEDRKENVNLEAVGMVLRITLTPYKGIFCNAMWIKFKVVEPCNEPVCKGKTHYILVIINKELSFTLEIVPETTRYFDSLLQLNHEFVIEFNVVHVNGSGDTCYETNVSFGLPFIAREKMLKGKQSGK